jgi:hypothetical protein
VAFKEEPRIPVSPGLLIELLNGLYFVMFNGQPREALRALELIQQRACYELYADVLLVTNAVMNSLRFNPSGQPEDGPMGISIALQNTAIKKDAITNASFRAKKLPGKHVDLVVVCLFSRCKMHVVLQHCFLFVVVAR